MMMNGKFTSADDFRENASDEDYKKLHDFYNAGTKNFPSKDSPKDDCIYQFSSATALNLLKERGLKKDNTNTIVEENRIVISTTRKNFLQKKFGISEENFERLERIYIDYQGIEKNIFLTHY